MDMQGETVSICDVDKYGLLTVVAVFAKYRLILVLGFIAAVVIAGLYWLLTPENYDSSSTFIPSSRVLGDSDSGQLGALKSAALSFGVSVSAGKADPSLLYSSFLESRVVAEKAIMEEFVDANGDTLRLADRFSKDHSSREEVMYYGRKWLRNKVLRVSTDPKTGMTTVKVRLENRQIASELANFLVREVEEFNRGIRAQHAIDQYEFIDKRYEEIAGKLEDAESELRVFLEENQVRRDSPTLELRLNKLQRNVNFYESLYSNMGAQLELARIESIKDFPTIIVVDVAQPAAFKSSPRLGKALVLFVFVIMFGLCIVVLLVDYFVGVSESMPIMYIRSVFKNR
ncbi:hypothetical protein KDM41_07625 [bacterium]|nr:hypothetical protein [bacterium]